MAQLLVIAATLALLLTIANNVRVEGGSTYAVAIDSNRVVVKVHKSSSRHSRPDTLPTRRMVPNGKFYRGGTVPVLVPEQIPVTWEELGYMPRKGSQLPLPAARPQSSSRPRLSDSTRDLLKRRVSERTRR